MQGQCKRRVPAFLSRTRHDLHARHRTYLYGQEPFRASPYQPVRNKVRRTIDDRSSASLDQTFRYDRPIKEPVDAIKFPSRTRDEILDGSIFLPPAARSKHSSRKGQRWMNGNVKNTAELSSGMTVCEDGESIKPSSMENRKQSLLADQSRLPFHPAATW